MNSDLTFIANEKNKNFLGRFKVNIKNTQVFDVLVGYFFTSGFDALYKSLEKTKKIGGFVPDLIAKKGNGEIIKEIETKDTNERDKEQQEAFKKYAERKRTRRFSKKVI